MTYPEIRQELHSHPQTAGNEQVAHDLIVRHLQGLHPSKVYTRVGGWGVVAVWGTNPSAPTVALRADTDALPIGHRCGHDGHTTALLRACQLVDERRHQLCASRNMMAIFQPAEETGQGALAVIGSGILEQYNIVRIFGCHNLPGFALGTVVVCPRTFAAASAGIVFHLQGRETHASTPELGLNPGLAVAEMVQRFAQFNGGRDADFRQSTLICVRVGSAAFGTSAGEAEVMFTLRAFGNEAMERLLSDATAAAQAIAARHGLRLEWGLQEPFHATENHAIGVEDVERAADGVPLRIRHQVEPFRWSEDFAEYLLRWPGAMYGIGSGERQPELHHPSYDFPDALIEPLAQMHLQLAATPL